MEVFFILVNVCLHAPTLVCVVPVLHWIFVLTRPLFAVGWRACCGNMLKNLCNSSSFLGCAQNQELTFDLTQPDCYTEGMCSGEAVTGKFLQLVYQNIVKF